MNEERQWKSLMIVHVRSALLTVEQSMASSVRIRSSRANRTLCKLRSRLALCTSIRGDACRRNEARKDKAHIGGSPPKQLACGEGATHFVCLLTRNLSTPADSIERCLLQRPFVRSTG